MKSKEQNIERGFTLIELLVTVAIIGILASIAVPAFSDYKRRAFDAAARSDLRNAAIAEEAYFVDNNKYVTCAHPAECISVLDGLSAVSPHVFLEMSVVDASSFRGEAFSELGSLGADFEWDSADGGMIE